MKVYITKYALTRGIYQTEVETSFDIAKGMVSSTTKGYLNSFYKPDWHETWEGAVERANFIKEKKILSLEKQLKKFKALSF